MELRLSPAVIKLTAFTIVMAVACVFLFKGCDNDLGGPSTNLSKENDSLKMVNAEKDRINDSLLGLSKGHDSVRVEYVTKWKKAKRDTAFLPCDSVLKLVITICDTIMFNDSAHISVLKQVIKNDSVTKSNYKKIIKNDSTTIVGLNKEVKKQKRQKKIFAGIAVVAAGIAIIK